MSIPLIPFARYALYRFLNWNPVLAAFIVKDEWRGERKYGLRTFEQDDLQQQKVTGVNKPFATVYEGASYYLLEHVLAQLQPSPDDMLADIGCGKGRAICVAAHYGFHQLRGIDFSEAFCARAFQNIQYTLSKLPHAVDATVTHADALEWPFPPQLNYFFLFNPFGETVMRPFIQRIKDHALQTRRKITVVYLSPVYKALFLENGFTETFRIQKYQLLEGCLLVFEPE
jgi:SAM-dependent methyltransferase